MSTARKLTAKNLDDRQVENTSPDSGTTTKRSVVELALRRMRKANSWLAVGFGLALAMAIVPFYAADSATPAVSKASALLPATVTASDTSGSSMTRVRTSQPGSEPITYMNYVPPAPLGLAAGGPSIGSNWRTDTLMYGAALQSLRLGFDDCSSPGVAAWQDLNYVVSSEAPRDAVLFTDSQTGRTFVAYLAGGRSLMAFTDNDGWSWIRSNGGAITSDVDHQTVGGGVFHHPLTRDPNGSLYADAVYYCSQNSAGASCARSDDGGLTFGPPVPIFVSAECGGVYGHLKVGPDGTVYLPSRSCGHGPQALAVSEDNGATWTVRKVPGSVPFEPVADPSVGIASDGTIYFGYAGRDGHPKVAVSHDKGLSWKTAGDPGISFGIQNTAFPAMVAGDPDRAALAFMGSSTRGNGTGVDAGSNGAWYLYVAHTYDGGLTWTTVNATPNDPVQLGSICRDRMRDGSCRSPRDFMDATIDRLGRVVVGHADGCGASCVDGPSDSRTVRASVARQVNGKRMFVQYDGLDVPAAPLATGIIDPSDNSLAHLSWSSPDDHGSAITGYRIDRRTASGSFAPMAEVPPGLAYDDRIDPAQSYVYRITAINAVGEGPSCDQVLLQRVLADDCDDCFVAAGPAPVALGAASTFGVLAASTVTSTGATTVNGDLGVSPGTTVAGAPIVTGTLHLGDPIAAQAQLDLTAAYNDAASRTVGVVGVAGNLGGRTLVPGLYKSTSSLEISSGDLTLDAQGDPTAIFIFQMASTLVTTVGRQVILSGGAQAANIFWQVGSSATLGTGSTFKGNILALASITVTTGATADGRMLARTGAVTLDTNVVGLAGPVVTGPTVSSTVPAHGATSVAIDAKIAAVFSQPMNPSTITTTTFTLRQGTTQVAGRVTYIGTTATFAPVGNLEPNTTYTATITTGARDLFGHPLASAFVWSFTTSPNRDTTRPRVSYQVPANGATDVPIRSKIAVTFSEPMDPLTIDTNTFDVRQAGGGVAGTVTYVGVTATFTPTASLAPRTVYTARIKPGAKDLAGNALAGDVNGFAWSFTTGEAPDTTRPTVTFAVPANGATGVPISQKIAATFSEPMDPLTTTTATFFLSHGATPVVGTVTYAGVTATFTPLSALAPSTAYTATITTGTRDLAGNPLAAAFVWSFTTGVSPDTIRPTVTFTVPTNAATGVAITQKIAATFSEAMDPLTTTTLTYTLKQGTTPVVGTVVYAGVTATFNPLNALAPSTVYTATITTGAKDLAGNALAAAFVWSFTTGATADTIRPTVSLVIPANAATGVAISGNIAAAFSEAMDPLTTTTVTFTLKQGTTPVVGTVTYAGVTATFNPLNTLAPLTAYTATITTGAKDLAGNALANEFVWSFTTGVTPDTTRPTVSFTVPANSAIGVAISQKIVATFSEAMDPSTISTATFTLKQGTTAVAGTVVYIGVTATFTPAAALAPLTVYTAAITTGAKDLAGNALLSNFGWSFTTGATPDTTRPTVSSTVPANAATAVAINQTVNATFSEPMDPLTINTASLTLRGPSGAAVTGIVAYAVASKIATFTPTSNLAPNAVYTATVTTGARDLAGNAVAANFVWTFTTAATVAGQSPVALGSASTFAVLAGSTITNTGASTVNGDLGLSPGTAVTGFPPGIVNGTIHAGDPAAAQAQLDLTIAYNDAAGRTVGAIGLSGNLGGQTLTPGLYKSTSSLEVSSGDLTLDAQGDANAVFIFQMASTLTTTTARQVILSGGAQAANVFWQVGSSATLGTGSSFKGNILALASITVTTGAAVEGRLLARTGAVTLDTSVVGLAIPADTTAPTVSLTSPVSGATGVAIGKKIAANFSEAMDPLTISASSFTVKQGTTAVAGTVGYVGVTATFTPASALAPLTAYTATITTGAKDLAGNALANQFVWSFTTGVTADTTRPTVSVTVPVNAALGVAINQTITAAFSEAMDPLTISPATFTLKQGTTAVAGTVVYIGVTATFTPAAALAPLTVYTAAITTGAKDLAGNALLSNFGWSFTTGATPDTTRPTVSSTVPANAATAVAINQTVNATFSEPMDPLTINTASLTLRGPSGAAVTGIVAYAVASKIATFTPTSNLAPNAVYTATVTTGARDLAGNAVASNFVWTFTTAATVAGQSPVALGSASTFAVLAGSTITNTGASTVNGDLGLSPGTAVTGFPPGIVNGTIHAGDPAAAQAQLDLTIAYNDAAGRTVGAIGLSGNLGGQTLTPGLYKSTSSLEISSGDLTLDAQGDANAVFIFQMASTLTTTTARQVILSGGAQAANVFWQVGSSATLGTGSSFKGNILALASITVTTGAAVEGRLLARTAAVTLDTSVVGLAIPADTTSPTVSFTAPLNAATGVAISQKIAATFSEAMNPLTISASSFTVKQGTTAVAGTVGYVGVTATFTPASALAPLTAYTATITTGAKDLAGNALANQFVWSFTTGLTPDTTRPTVSVTVPVNAALGVAINQTITAAFSEAMDPSTISPATFTVKQGTTAVAGTVVYIGVTATFTPAAALAPLTVYTAAITTGAKDLAGNALLSNFGWSFTTGATPDTTRPTVSSTVPANAATAVAINQTVNATFSEPMDPLTINTASLTLRGPSGTAVIGTVGYAVASKIATFTPTSNLAPNAVYTATVTTGARDLAGNAVAANFVWTFTTAATVAGQSPVALGSASTFAVLAGSTITNTGASTVNGDLGLSPGTAVTGFPPGIVNGTIHAGDPAAAQAQLDLTIAYNDAAGRTVGAIGLSGNLGGQTLTPGLYKSTSSLEISSGDLTLDAQGDANAVFIFQMASTLTTTTARQVILSGGAQAANVFWQVGSSATLGTGSSFKGNILALASITVTTGAAVEGRLLARTAAVTLDTSVVGLAIPADTTAPTVSFTAPLNAATGVAISQKIAATFSEAMDPLTISASSFTVKQGTTAVAGTVGYVGVTATFTPASALAPLTAYTATITTGAKDLAGNALANQFVWSFTTGLTPDTTRPTVSVTVPVNAALGVAINQTITAAFSEAMDPLTISPATFTLKQGTTAVAGTVVYIGVTATFTPAAALAPLTVYTAAITTGAKDLAGNALLSNFGWSFTTGATPDTTRPTVSSTVPANAATAVAINQTVNATFSEPMDPLTINTASLTLRGPSGAAVTGTVGYAVASKIATFTPTSNLAPNAAYTATVTTGARDLAGNAVAANFVWTFTTAATVAGQSPVALGSASTFAVLAGSTITNTGASTVNGDLGLSPGTAVTGFPPGIVNGTIHAGDPAAAQAQLDLTIAYNNAAGRTVGVIGLSGNLGGQTLTPGLYKSTSSLEISSGDLTLDAQGDANAVFIFQMASTLVTTVGRQVILSGGAQAANVFWQVGSSATLGTGSSFKGNILALASITVTTGAAVEGRLLARTAAVTLDTSVVGF